MQRTFLQRWFQKLGGPAAAATAPTELHASLFGKHRAWDDHMPDLGIDHPLLIQFKQALYEAITANVDNGAWQKLEQAGQAQSWGHSFYQEFTGGALLGRMWYSKDGLGRDRYPLVATILWPGILLPNQIRLLGSLLHRLQARCEEAASPADVEAALQATRTAAAAEITSTPDATTRRLAAAPGPSEAVNVLSACEQLGPDRQGLLRVIYHLERELSLELTPRSVNTRQSSRDPESSAAIRVPSCGQSSGTAGELWVRFLNYFQTPGLKLSVCPDHCRWVDVLVGKSGPSHMYCLRAGLEALPFTSDIPYSFTEEFARRAEALLGSHNPAAPKRSA